MTIKKITTGFVIQVFDTDLNRYTSQEFVAGDTDYENDDGEALDFTEIPFKDGTEPYLPFDMKQPE